jgi:hypothetical protein
LNPPDAAGFAAAGIAAHASWVDEIIRLAVNDKAKMCKSAKAF